MSATPAGPIESRQDFKKDPAGRYKYWEMELGAARKRLKKWHKAADNIVRRYKDERGRPGAGSFRLNLFSADVNTILSMLYGKLPRVDVSRTDTLGNDDVARVAAEMMERILRLDVEEHGEEYDAVLHATLQDRLLAGLGVARVRYEFKEVRVAAEVDQVAGGRVTPLAAMQQTRTDECAPIDYYYWGDVLWSWGRKFKDLDWIAFRAYLTRDEMIKRFGEKLAKEVPLKAQTPEIEAGQADSDQASAWNKGEVWEIWDKRSKRVYWVALGVDKVLDVKDDPLRLKNFFPCPAFMLANPTTALYHPTPDFHLAEDLYNQIDVLQARISVLTDAVKVVGVYDASADGVQRMFNEGVENTLIPVDNWAMFAEKGGIQGQVDWLPIIDIANVLDKLRAVRDETIQLLRQVTGMADIMRGDLTSAYEGVGQTQIKAQFGSARMQALQEQFARFAGQLLSLKAEVICRHFDEVNITRMANAAWLSEPDQQLVPQAVKLLKEPQQARLRINVRSETMAQQDYSMLKQERSEYLQGLSGFLQSAAPLAQQDRRSLPFLLEMLRWAMAGFKGSSEIEGVLDVAIDTMRKPEAQQEQKPDPEQVRADTQIKLEELRAQAKMQETQAKLQADLQMREADRQADIQTEQAKMQMEMARIQAETQAELQKFAAKLEADVRTELLTSQINVEQAERAGDVEIEKEIMRAKTEIAKMRMQKRAEIGTRMMEKEADAAIAELREAHADRREAAKLEEQRRAAAVDSRPGDGEAGQGE